MGRHSVDTRPAGSGDQPDEQPGDDAAFSEYETGSHARVTPGGPPGSSRRVAVAVGVAMLGIVLLVFGLVTLISTPDQAPSAGGEETTSASQAPAPTTIDLTTPAATSGPATPAVLPVTILNNSPVVGLASQIAEALMAGGWPIAELLNYDETQVEATTAYFTPGNAEEEAAALALVAQFPEISGGAEPRFEGLDGSGLTVAAVGDWRP